MKFSKVKYFITVLILFVAAANHLIAQTNDALLKVLVEKNIITQVAADSLKAEAVKRQNEEKEKQKKFEITAGKLLQLNGYTQFRYQSFQQASKIDGADLRRVRLDFKGAITTGWDYRLQLDFATSPKILDGYINFTLDNYLKITAGQFKIPLSLENLTSSQKLESIDRSQIVEALTARGTDVIGNQNGRDIGLQLSGSLIKNEEQYLLDYYLGLFNGTGINTADKNKPKDFAGRIVLHPIKGIDVGASYYNGYDIWGTPAKAQARIRTGAELKFVYELFGITAEYLFGEDGGIKKNGWYALIGYYIIPKKLQPIIKLDSYNPNKDLDGVKSTAYTFGANFFFNEWTKIQANYTLKKEETEEINNDIFSTQIQLFF